MKTSTGTAIAVAVLVAGITAYHWIGGDEIVIAAGDPARGERLYAENCAACHGANLEGQPNWQKPNANGTLPAPPHDDSGHTWHHPDSMLFAYTKMGGKAWLEANGVTGFTSAMPGFEDVMTDEEIGDVLAFIRSRWSERARQTQAEITAKAR
jgi:mono/diheme cytochrome c family protein